MPLEYETDEALARSTNQWIAVGAGLLLVMALVFPSYRWYEPTSRHESREPHAASLAEEGENLWQFNRASCHGLAGEGASGRRSTRSSSYRPRPTSRCRP